MPGYVAMDERKPIKPGKDVFPPGARRFEGGGVQNVAGQRKGYRPGAATKLRSILSRRGMTPARARAIRRALVEGCSGACFVPCGQKDSFSLRRHGRHQ